MKAIIVSLLIIISIIAGISYFALQHKARQSQFLSVDVLNESLGPFSNGSSNLALRYSCEDAEAQSQCNAEGAVVNAENCCRYFGKCC